jgi:hypothetical protein
MEFRHASSTTLQRVLHSIFVRPFLPDYLPSINCSAVANSTNSVTITYLSLIVQLLGWFKLYTLRKTLTRSLNGRLILDKSLVKSSVKYSRYLRRSKQFRSYLYVFSLSRRWIGWPGRRSNLARVAMFCIVFRKCLIFRFNVLFLR